MKQTGTIFSKDHKTALSKAAKERWENHPDAEKHRKNLSVALSATWTPKRRKAHSAAMKERWTPARRKAHSRKIKAAWAKKRAAK